MLVKSLPPNIEEGEAVGAELAPAVSGSGESSFGPPYVVIPVGAAAEAAVSRDAVPGTAISNGGLYSNVPVKSSIILIPYLFPGAIFDESSKSPGTVHVNEPEFAKFALITLTQTLNKETRSCQVRTNDSAKIIKVIGRTLKDMQRDCPGRCWLGGAQESIERPLIPQDKYTYRPCYRHRLPSV